MPRAPQAKPARAPKANAQQTLVQAVTLHQQGRLDDAERLYNGVLQGKPGDFDALHLLGVLMHQRGRSGEALKLIAKALESGARSADAHANQGRVFAALGRHAEAVESFEKALALKDDHIEALFHRGGSLIGLGRFADALASYERMLAMRPGHAPALVNRGVALLMLGRAAEALASQDEVLALHPDHTEALMHRGHALVAMRCLDEALASYDRTLAIRPNDSGTLFARGNLLRELGRFGDALASYDVAITLRADCAEYYSNRGNVLCDLNRPSDALASFDRALELRPREADILNNRGNALLQLSRPAEAIKCYDEALTIRPDDAQALINRGNALCDLRRPDEALASYDKVIAAASDHAEAHWNKSLVLLARGEFARGWREYEWRLRRAGADRRNFSQPQWQGDPGIAGKTILLHAEQGFGDTIQFVRYAPILAAMGAKVVIEVQASLMVLMSSLPGVSEIVGRGAELPPFDLHCPLMSLPLAFGTVLDTIPAAKSYLKAPQPYLEKWELRLSGPKWPRVGLVWSGSPTHKNDHNRSMPLSSLAPLLSQPGVECFSLQRDMRAADLAALEAGLPVVQLGPDLQDFADTAAAITLLDLVITVDTGVAHLAGALGKPVFILLPFNGEWRWLADREDSPWYPSARLFRQPAPGDWDSVIARVGSELADKA
jgi:tetratricopeptide (TPR) repeat protein